VCLEPIVAADSGPDLGCQREQGVCLGVSIKADGETLIDTDTDTGMARHTACTQVCEGG
jgi:hypothetical protein